MAARGEAEGGLKLRRCYAAWARVLPRSLVSRLEAAAPLHPFELLYRRALRRALRSGPPYRPSYRSIVIDVTTRCNLRCVDCNRSCGSGQRRVEEDLPLETVDRLVSDSVELGHRWRVIQIEGGEPTLHPDIDRLVARLQRYIARHAPSTHLTLVSNHHGDAVRRTVERLVRRGVDVQGDHKTTSVQEHHCAFNVAPCDMAEMLDLDFAEGCHLPVLHGLGLCTAGYFAHPVCGGIDRVFGLGLGRPRLPEPGDPLDDQFASLCRLCGCYRMSYRMRGARLPVGEEELRGRISPVWRRAYDRQPTRTGPRSTGDTAAASSEQRARGDAEGEARAVVGNGGVDPQQVREPDLAEVEDQPEAGVGVDAAGGGADPRSPRVADVDER